MLVKARPNFVYTLARIHFRLLQGWFLKVSYLILLLQAVMTEIFFKLRRRRAVTELWMFVYVFLFLQTETVSSLKALLKYIDQTQLTRDLEGTFHYDHNHWIQFRQVSVTKATGVECKHVCNTFFPVSWLDAWFHNEKRHPDLQGNAPLSQINIGEVCFELLLRHD